MYGIIDCRDNILMEHWNSGILECWKKEMKEYWENMKNSYSDTNTVNMLGNVGMVLKTPVCDIENTKAGEY